MTTPLDDALSAFPLLPPLLPVDALSQFIADLIDATIVAELVHPEVDDAEIERMAFTRLATEGYAGRRYHFTTRPDGSPWWPDRVEQIGPITPSEEGQGMSHP